MQVQGELLFDLGPISNWSLSADKVTGLSVHMSVQDLQMFAQGMPKALGITVSFHSPSPRLEEQVHCSELLERLECRDVA